MPFIKRIFVDDTGATAIEYGLIAALIAVAAITAMGSLGNALSNNFTMVANAENSANTTASA
jgi:pilus assembly protein Flp/PilA